MGGVPGQIVSDNLKAGITKACFYEPAVNRTYADMAAHYDTAVVPARPRKPRDKAKVEVAGWIPTRSATRSSKPDLNVTSKLGEHGFDGCFEAEALSRG